ncbi:LPS export ABC transporter permease LptG [Candidatus Vallotia cooleyia]|uniref:LPS export ABC transporter permease LptG n=1 Tax=Candidatus Vallotiella adelgis TaxID=1177211 RepID=UPI001D02F8FB|nr:LPS export ABC transporter permease LptG [Candidatus Vallotia cooleyia]UDG82118.1 Lipopolysaccharide export system permease protein LptG [Candidatus Vallotia cooleyia]
MRLYERYFAKQIYLTFAFVLFACSGLFFFFDLISELNSLRHGNYKFSYAILRVMLQMPSRFYEIIPVVTLISAIHVFAQIAASSEFTIFRVSGLSTHRALGSILRIGVPIVVLTFVIGEVVTPYTHQLSERVCSKMLSPSASSQVRSSVWVKDTLSGNGKTAYITRFISVREIKPDATIANILIYEFDSRFRLASVRTANSGCYVRPGQWLLYNVTETRLHNISPASSTDKDVLNPVYRSEKVSMPKYQMHSSLTPKILSVLLITPDRMSITNLLLYVKHLRDNHQNTQRYIIALWSKVFYPFAVLVMLVLSLPFAYLHTSARVVGIKVFAGIMLGISFQLLNTIFAHIGMLNTWPALFTAAIPVLIYLALGLLALHWINHH